MKPSNFTRAPISNVENAASKSELSFSFASPAGPVQPINDTEIERQHAVTQQLDLPQVTYDEPSCEISFPTGNDESLAEDDAIDSDLPTIFEDTNQLISPEWHKAPLPSSSCIPVPVKEDDQGECIDMPTEELFDDCDLLGADQDDEDAMLKAISDYETNLPSQKSATNLALPRSHLQGNATAESPRPESLQKMHCIDTDPFHDDQRISTPIIRPQYPKPVLDRSVITGVTSKIILRSCFRIGEAINVGSEALRTGDNVILELHALVDSSYREPESVEQHFVFTDMWAERSPVLTGTYKCWKGSKLWDEDAAVFLGHELPKKMCRCIARMKRMDNKWTLSILSIWKAHWDDVGFTKGIVCE